MRINGPYVHTTGKLKGRRYINIIDGSKKTTMLYSRYLMQEHLGRTLLPSEHVDHIDEDKTNDNIDNLQILSLSENAKKAALKRLPKWVEFICPVCGNSAKKLKRIVDHNLKMGKAGPYCGRRCAGKAHN